MRLLEHRLSMPALTSTHSTHWRQCRSLWCRVLCCWGETPAPTPSQETHLELGSQCERAWGTNLVLRRKLTNRTLGLLHSYTRMFGTRICEVLWYSGNTAHIARCRIIRQKVANLYRIYKVRVTTYHRLVDIQIDGWVDKLIDRLIEQFLTCSKELLL